MPYLYVNKVYIYIFSKLHGLWSSIFAIFGWEQLQVVILVPQSWVLSHQDIGRATSVCHVRFCCHAKNDMPFISIDFPLISIKFPFLFISNYFPWISQKNIKQVVFSPFGHWKLLAINSLGFHRLLHSIPESAPRVSLQNMMNILGFDGD